ncbi:BOS complex subunit ncln isoform X1 [Hydra vulgaris]|uniref:BOS complex subunit ncln isoform X1 n=1 Tax=Hydra vulgaris TaxID=6087 RepID=UPI001F5E5115|nr:nicalin-1 [Hydra vulgaris]
MVGDTENIMALFRDMPTAVCFLMIVPIIIISASSSAVAASNDFPVYRMQQYDLYGAKYGSRSASINLEARSLISDNLIRRCAVVRIAQLQIDQLQKAISDGLSALLILLPANIEKVSNATLERIQYLENNLLQVDLPIPVYFSHETDALKSLFEEITSSVHRDTATSAVKAMTAVASANSFHFLTDAGESQVISDFPIISLQGKLTGQGLEDQLPTVAIVTHYDSFSIVPKLSYGADATASGVVALLELARLFNLLYSEVSTRPKYNLLFLLAGGGKFNYQGTKKWIEQNVESSEISLLAEADYVLCIDAIGQGNSLNLHVSKPPKEGTQSYLLVQEFKKVMSDLYSDSVFNVVHKKVNLAEDMLDWEHERFSMRRLPAGTFSHYDKPTQRGSILDTKINSVALERNIRVIAEGLARHIYNLSGKSFSNKLEIFSGNMALDLDHINSWMNHLLSQPRSQQLINKENRLLSAMEEILIQYLHEVKRIVTKADKKEPEFVFYDVFESKMSVYSVKPALFDLILAIGIAFYLCIVYIFVENFTVLIALLPTLKKQKTY